MDKYKDWELFENLPNGWRIDKSCGTPLTGYDFCINGSALKGGKRALVRVDKTKYKVNKIQQFENISKNEIQQNPKITNDTPFPAKTVNILARKKFEEQLLKEIRFDLMVCEIEEWDKKEYIKELKNLLNSIDTSRKKKSDTEQISLFDKMQ